MASFEKHLADDLAYLKKWEGGFSNHHLDKGGATNMGVTLATWNDFAAKNGWQTGLAGLLNMTETQYRKIIYGFWLWARADKIDNQVIAEKVFEMTWGSGAGNAGVILQKALRRIGFNVKIDGDIGPKTLDATNSADASALFEALHAEHKKFLIGITQNDPSQKVFLQGWLNRINDFYQKKKGLLPQAPEDSPPQLA